MSKHEFRSVISQLWQTTKTTAKFAAFQFSAAINQPANEHVEVHVAKVTTVMATRKSDPLIVGKFYALPREGGVLQCVLLRSIIRDDRGESVEIEDRNGRVLKMKTRCQLFKSLEVWNVGDVLECPSDKSLYAVVRGFCQNGWVEVAITDGDTWWCPIQMQWKDLLAWPYNSKQFPVKNPMFVPRQPLFPREDGQLVPCTRETKAEQEKNMTKVLNAWPEIQWAIPPWHHLSRFHSRKEQLGKVTKIIESMGAFGYAEILTWFDLLADETNKPLTIRVDRDTLSTWTCGVGARNNVRPTDPLVDYLDNMPMPSPTPSPTPPAE